MSSGVGQGAEGIGPIVSLTGVFDALYRVLLGRAPDPDGLDMWVGIANQDGMARALAGFVEGKEYRSRVLSRRSPGEQWSFSQHGEVEVLLSLMLRDAVANRVIVDVGAADIRLSNSVDLVTLFGWRGVLVEPNPELAQRLRQSLAGWDAEVLECAISTQEGVAQLHLGINEHVSSLDSEFTRAWGAVQGSINVQTRILASVLDEHNIPKDFGVLTLDIEGLDFQVINDLLENSAYRPDWIIFEWGVGWAKADLSDSRLAAKVAEEYRIATRVEGNVILRRGFQRK